MNCFHERFDPGGVNGRDNDKSSMSQAVSLRRTSPQFILATAATSSPGLTFMIRTPWVDRPCTRMSLVGILIITPSLVVTSSSSSSETVVVQQT